MTAYTKRLQKVTAVLCTTALLAGCAAGTSDNTCLLYTSDAADEL